MTDWNNEEERNAAIAEIVEQEKQGLVNKNSELLGKLKELQPKASIADEVDVEEYKELKASAAKREEEALIAKQKFDEVRARDKEDFAKQLEIASGNAAKLKDTVYNLVVEKELTNVLSKHKGNDLLLMPHLKDRVEMVEEDGAYTVRVKDSTGNTMFNSEGGNATLEDLIVSLKQDDRFKAAFAGNQASGSGASANSGASDTEGKNPWDPRHRNITEQTKIYKADPAKAKSMAAMFGVKL